MEFVRIQWTDRRRRRAIRRSPAATQLLRRRGPPAWRLLPRSRRARRRLRPEAPCPRQSLAERASLDEPVGSTWRRERSLRCCRPTSGPLFCELPPFPVRAQRRRAAAFRDPCREDAPRCRATQPRMATLIRGPCRSEDGRRHWARRHASYRLRRHAPHRAPVSCAGRQPTHPSASPLEPGARPPPTMPDAPGQSPSHRCLASRGRSSHLDSLRQCRPPRSQEPRLPLSVPPRIRSTSPPLLRSQRYPRRRCRWSQSPRAGPAEGRP